MDILWCSNTFGRVEYIIVEKKIFYNKRLFVFLTLMTLGQVLASLIPFVKSSQRFSL